MAKVRPIPTPLGQHWQRIRLQLMPLLVFLAACGISVWLWNEQRGTPMAVGEAEVQWTNLSAPANGTLVHLTPRDWKTFERVTKDQVVARLDANECVAALAVIHTQIEKIRKELSATEAKTR